MNTTADKLELLLRTKERQKAYLQEKYPLLDFDTIPFRAYLDLFQGRSYVPGFVGGWKAYGRSNDEDADTRKYLYDYSGNGRDIELFNFAFAGMSGYGGYGTDSWTAYGSNSEQINSTTVKLTAAGEFNGVKLGTINRGDADITIRYRVAGVLPTYGLELYTNTSNSEGHIIPKIIREINADGEYEDSISFDGDTAGSDINYSSIFLVCRTSSIIEGTNLLIEQLPLYPGALVSDGVDDYGQCIKDFALPDDYTVVAVRKRIFQSSGILISKGNMSTSGIGVEVDGGLAAYSYGKYSSVSDAPALFSYQTKSSYNGQVIDVGTGIDTTEDKLRLFNDIPSSNYVSYALYDVRIYDHSLTAEELQTVKDEMMSDYENATGGGIADITYVADWDGKGRSNDEEADVRSQWIDKATGKVINLSNYSYSQMSGWGGYNFDFTQKWQSDSQFSGGVSVVKNDHKAVITFLQDNSRSVNFYVSYLNEDPVIPAQKLRIKSSQKLAFSYGQEAGNYIEIPSSVEGDNYIVDIPECKIFLIFIKGPHSSGDVITIEQLPLYPGALVSDGVDDYISEDGVLGEAVGTVLIHWKDIGLPNSHFLYNTGWEDTNRLYCWRQANDNNLFAGLPSMWMTGEPIMYFTREPAIPKDPLNNTAGENNCPIFRLIFIKEKLDDAQLETLTWKVSKEYRDWCKENGYEYAISEMLNN